MTAAAFAGLVLACSDGGTDPEPESGSVEGTVTSAQGGALGGVTVTASPGGLIDVTDVADGAYAIDDLTPGDYTLALTELPSGCEDPGSQQATVTSGSATTVNFTVTCAPTGSIAGSIISPQRGPLGEVTVTVLPGDFSAISASGTGTYEFGDLPPGDYTVALSSLPADCEVPGPLPVTVSPDASAVADFSVSCPSIYVANFGSNTISIFPLSASGDVDPAAIIGGPSTALDLPTSLAIDEGSRLHVANFQGNSVTVYPAGATGDVSPVAIIAGPSTQLDGPEGLALDNDGNIYVVSNSNTAQRVTIYGAGATGDAAPIAIIEGPNTGLDRPGEIAVDATGRLYVSNGAGNAITIFDAGANGDISPAATIAGSETELMFPSGVALDASGQIYVSDLGPGPDFHSIRIFAAGASGNVAPVATIDGPDTELDHPLSVFVDEAGRIYVPHQASAEGPRSITIYSGGATGNVSPIASISGPRTLLNQPAGVTVSP